MRLKNEDIEKIARLVDEGYSSGYIANKYNYSRQGMQRIIARYKRHGLKGILHGQSKSFTIDEKITIPLGLTVEFDTEKEMIIEL